MTGTREWQPPPKCGLLYKRPQAVHLEGERDSPLLEKASAAGVLHPRVAAYFAAVAFPLPACGYHSLTLGAYVTEIMAQYKCPEHLVPDPLNA